MEEGRRWLQSRLRRYPETQRRRRVVEAARKEGNDEVLRELIGEVLPSDWADRELVPRCLSWLQDRKNSRRATALRSLWQYVQFTHFDRPVPKSWVPHYSQQSKFEPTTHNVFEIAEDKDTVPLLLSSLRQSLLRQSSSQQEDNSTTKTNEKRKKKSSSSLERVAVPSLYEKKNKQKEKKVAIANDEDRLMSVLEEKLLALTLLAALSVAFSVETALDVADMFLPIVEKLVLGLESDGASVGAHHTEKEKSEKKSRKKNEADALLRCAALELYTELLYFQHCHSPSSSRHSHPIYLPRNRQNGPLAQAERSRAVANGLAAWDKFYEEAIRLVGMVLRDECCSVRRTAVSMLAFWISVFPTALVHSFFNDFFEELVELLEDQDLFVRTEAGQALATLLLLNLDEEDDDPNSKKEAAEEEEEEEEEREEHYYEVGSFALLQVEEKVKELCWQRDFKFDRKGNGLQFKTFKRLREVVKHCRQLEEDREEALRNDRSDRPHGFSISSLTQAALQLKTKTENGAEYEDKEDEEEEEEVGEEEEEEEKHTQQAEDIQLAEQRNLAEMFFGELRVPLTNMAYLRLQKHWHGMLALRHGDKVEWKVRWWRGIVQLQTLSRIIGPSFGHSITVSFAVS
ncbi:hypothetical protein QOT17_014039 [Balamuthia mandrillaris]